MLPALNAPSIQRSSSSRVRAFCAESVCSLRNVLPPAPSETPLRCRAQYECSTQQPASAQARQETGPTTSGKAVVDSVGSLNSQTLLHTGLLLQLFQRGSSFSHRSVDSLDLRSSEAELQTTALPVQVDEPPAPIKAPPSRPGKDPKKREDFYANVGEAIRVLRAETPLLFQEDLTYDIYRDDITFRDPRNTFHGKKDYRTIFWSLRFHGKLFFRVLYVDVLRIWESPENVKDAGTVLKMRWSVHGIPRVPWDAEGIFDGISTFKLDSNGKIFEHMVNNVILKDPPKEGNPFLAGLNLIPLPQQQQPCPGAWFKSARANRETKPAAPGQHRSEPTDNTSTAGGFVEQF